MRKNNAKYVKPAQVEASLNVLNVITLSSCLQFLVTLGASWANRHVLPQLLNHQAQLELKLQEIIGSPVNERSSTRVEMLKRLLMLAVTLTLASIPIFQMATNAQSHADSFLETFVNPFVLGSLVVSVVLHEYVIVLSLRKLREQLERDRESMDFWPERQRKAVMDDVLDRLCDTVLRIRQQGDLLSRNLAPTASSNVPDRSHSVVQFLRNQ